MHPPVRRCRKTRQPAYADARAAWLEIRVALVGGTGAERVDIQSNAVGQVLTAS
jgi:hypothetical protein